MKLRGILMVLLTFVLFQNASHATVKETFKTKKYTEKHSKGLSRDKSKHLEFKMSKASHGHLLKLSEETPVVGKWNLDGKVSPCENQGGCGSCWDFSITKALRSALMLAGKDPGVLAFNYLLNNCGPGTNEYGCNGGDFDAGDNMLNKQGPWLESQDPYTQSEGRCKTGLLVAGTALSWNIVGSSNRPPTFQELATASYNSGRGRMLSIDVAVCGAWGSYSSGIFNRNDCGANSINHMINLIGYDCETSVDAQGNCVFSNGKPKNGDGYLIVRNNWGTGWGENGDMRTRYGIDAVADTAMYFEVEQAPPPPPPVDGGWSSYGPWSDCVNGKQSHSRTCTNPVPSNGGKDCVGLSFEEQSCTAPGPTPGPGSTLPWWAWLLIGAAVSGVVVLVIVKAVK